MFPTNTYLKILNFLDWSINRADEVKTALATAESDPEIEAEISDLILRLTTLCQAIEDGIACGENAMTKMDVIEWDVSKRGNDAKNLKNQLIKKLANLLSLDWSNLSTCSGGAITYDIDFR